MVSLLVQLMAALLAAHLAAERAASLGRYLEKNLATVKACWKDPYWALLMVRKWALRKGQMMATWWA
jgi:hypothetical protein